MKRMTNEQWRSVMQPLALVIIAIVTLEATSLIEHYFIRKTIREEATRRAEGQLESTSLQITDVMNQVETVVRNSVWAVRRIMTYPDTLSFFTGKLVESNDFISGSAVAFVENYFPDRGRMFSPYSFRQDGEVLSAQLGTESYNYLEKEWFTKPLELGTGYWSEPYFDSGGGKMFMTTYSVPISDYTGKMVAVLTADVSLDWLTGLVGGIDVYPGAFSILISRKGQFMVCPVPSLVMRNTVQEAAENLPDDMLAVQSVARAMLAGERGNRIVRYQGHREFIFYAPVERTGWSMAIVIPAEDVYGDFRLVRVLIIALQILGLLLLIYILYAAARNQMRLKDVTEKKSRIESELHIARNIQMSMLPKTFPTYPEHTDIDMSGLIVPAKEVGGDLIDFYIRDGKLFFCIGDVSGKGVPASLVMAVTRSLFRTVSAQEKSPQRIVSSMNDSMADMNENNMFVTFFLGVLDLNSGHLRYCNAGHNAPVRTGPDAAALLDVVPNLPLGVLPGMQYKEQETDLASNEGLFLYTDGLTEAENAEHVLFGEQRMLQTIRRRGGEKAEALVKLMKGEVQTHIHGCDPSDDLTMLVVRFTNPAPFLGAERQLTLRNDIKEIPRLAAFMDAIADETQLDQSLSMSLNLALEEVVSNVILYAYPAGTDGQVDIKAVIRGDRFDFIISDSGKPFDPTSVTTPDLTLDVNDRPVGGLGIYLAKTIMDHISYSWEEGRNILTMTKKR